MRLSLLMVVCFYFFLSGLATQTLDDGIRFSSRNRLGTARGIGVGSSLSTIGGDFGSLSVNPASVVTFRKSEIQITPGFFSGDADSRLTVSSEATELSENRSVFQFPSVSYVYVENATPRSTYHVNEEGEIEEMYTTSKWTRASFAIGINRVADFNRRISFEGDQTNSITQFFVEQSDFINPDDLDAFYGGPAFDALVTTYDEYTGEYSADIEGRDLVRKSQIVKQRGGIDELSFTVGADYDNRLQLGASINVPIYHFNEMKTYVESKSDHAIFRTLTLNENLNSTGSGFNFKLGGKYILSKKIHLGLAFHSPTWMRIEDDFDTRVEYDYIFDPILFVGPGPAEAESPDGAFEYRFRTPWRASGGLGVIIGRSGFISAEAEYVNYDAAKFSIEDDLDFEDDINRSLGSNLGSAFNFNFGGEVKIKSFRLRAGFGFEESIYESISGMELVSTSFGAGFWIDNIFIDAAYRYRDFDQSYSPYTLSRGSSPIILSAIKEQYFILTIGAKI